MEIKENEIENEKIKTEEQEQKNPLGAGISMIYPPPETKKVIDKAATLVAQYGIQVETSMKEDPNFSFINKSDPYYPYYQSKIIEFKEELLKDLSKKKEEYYSQNKDENQNPEFLNKKRKEDNLVELEKEAKVLLKEAMQDKIDLLRSDKNLNNLEKIPQPVPDMFSVAQPNISGTELDIIKISAQFVARNGQKFLSDLIRREKDNPQFDFMKPQHTLFGYFTFLVGCYAKILNKNEIMSKIEKYATNSDEILKSANMHYLYEKKMSKIPRGKRFSQEDLLTNEEKEKAKQIDWYDFVVIETINFSSDEEEKSENSNKEIVGKENIYNNNYNNSVNKEITDNDNATIYTNEDNNTIINSTEDERTFYTNNNNNMVKPNNGQEVVYINGKKVIKNYVREKKKRILDQGVDDVNEVKCPLCKLSIKPNKIEEHLKIELLDPKWKKIQEVIDKNQVQTNLAGTGDLLIYLDQFSKSRPDLFGEVDDIKKLEKKRKEEKEKNIDHVTFNGYAPLMSRTTANNNMIKIQNIRHIEESKKPKELKNIMKK